MRKIYYIIISLGILSFGCDQIDCENNIKLEIFSPNRINRAILFSRDCGATTGFNSQVTILCGKEYFKNEIGNTLIMDESPLQIQWINDNHLSIKIPNYKRISKKILNVNKVEITYEITE